MISRYDGMLFNIHLDEGRLAAIFCPQNSPKLFSPHNLGEQVFSVHYYLHPFQQVDSALRIRVF